MEDLLEPYAKPCQMDLKLGTASVEPDTGSGNAWKNFKRMVANETSYGKSEGARLAGYVVDSPLIGKYRYPPKGQKYKNALVSPHSALDSFFSLAGHGKDKATLAAFLHRFEELSKAWQQSFDALLRSVGLSVMMVYECGSGTEVSATPPKAFMIDYAHFFHAKARPMWTGSDGVVLGLQTIAGELKNRLAAATLPVVPTARWSDVSEAMQGRKCEDNWHPFGSEPLKTAAVCQKEALDFGMNYVDWRLDVNSADSTPNCPAGLEGASDACLGVCRICSKLVARTAAEKHNVKSLSSPAYAYRWVFEFSK
eukprot:TRINITY_DN34205_c0_g1_i3.p1 TRINITY_DN34205_c0_g1~~TRINITY_DN34205_c0_g1_i3.p1  ORF type:complete len:310 (-),score=63.65 TRINITY_DN34205_c0_g1_i3:276-1205(-)